MRQDTRDRRFDFIQESCAQTVLGSFVERDRFLEFLFRGGSEPCVHLRKSLRRSEKICPASLAFSLPSSKASIRRYDSSAQAASRDRNSGEARESQSTSISFALSPGGRPKTSA